MGSSWVGRLTAVMAVVVLAAWGWRLWDLRASDHFDKNPPLKAPDFAFPSQNGVTFSSAEVKGKVWVVDFIFSSCAGTCPLLSQQMKALQGKWKGSPDFKLVSFTVDPDRDTVAALKKYADALQADGSQWFFLTGDKKDLYRVAQEGFKLTAMPDPAGRPGYEFIHTTRLVLVDGNGMIRGFYDGQEDEDIKKLARDVRHLMSSRSKT